MTRALDAYTHILPRRYIDALLDVTADRRPLKRWLELDALHDVEARLRAIDAFDGYAQVISLSSPPIEVVATGERGAALARLANDEMAAICAKHPDQMPAFVASLPMADPELALRELDRAVLELGAVGAQVFTNVAGRPIDDEGCTAVLARVAELGVPLWLHPARGARFADYAGEEESQYEIWWALGWPYETTAAMFRLVFSRVLDRLPGLRVITHHMGGLAPYLEGRLALGLEQFGSRTPGDAYERLLGELDRAPLDYFRSFYADTALFGAVEATRCGLAFFGVERCLFASDFPFDPSGGRRLIEETMAAIAALNLEPDAEEAIMTRNLLSLTGIGVSG